MPKIEIPKECVSKDGAAIPLSYECFGRMIHDMFTVVYENDIPPINLEVDLDIPITAKENEIMDIAKRRASLSVEKVKELVNLVDHAVNKVTYLYNQMNIIEVSGSLEYGRYVEKCIEECLKKPVGYVYCLKLCSEIIQILNKDHERYYFGKSYPTVYTIFVGYNKWFVDNINRLYRDEELSVKSKLLNDMCKYIYYRIYTYAALYKIYEQLINLIIRLGVISRIVRQGVDKIVQKEIVDITNSAYRDLVEELSKYQSIEIAPSELIDIWSKLYSMHYVKKPPSPLMSVKEIIRTIKQGVSGLENDIKVNRENALDVKKRTVIKIFEALPSYPFKSKTPIEEFVNMEVNTYLKYLAEGAEIDLNNKSVFQEQVRAMKIMLIRVLYEFIKSQSFYKVEVVKPEEKELVGYKKVKDEISGTILPPTEPYEVIKRLSDEEIERIKITARADAEKVVDQLTKDESFLKSLFSDFMLAASYEKIANELDRFKGIVDAKLKEIVEISTAIEKMKENIPKSLKSAYTFIFQEVAYIMIGLIAKQTTTQEVYATLDLLQSSLTAAIDNYNKMVEGIISQAKTEVYSSWIKNVHTRMNDVYNFIRAVSFGSSPMESMSASYINPALYDLTLDLFNRYGIKKR